MTLVQSNSVHKCPKNVWRKLDTISFTLAVFDAPPSPHSVSNALMGVAASLPTSTRVFCGHEYTVSNLQFAKSVEPESSAVADKLDWSRKILAQGGYTVPSTVSARCGLLTFNVFLGFERFFMAR